MKKILAFLILLAMTCLPVFADPTITATSCTVTHVFESGTVADPTQVNTNFTNECTDHNEVKADLDTLAAGCATLADNETVTGIFTFNEGIAFEAGDGINDVFLLIDADNSGAAVDTSLRFQRGSDGEDSQILYDESEEDFEFHTDQSSTLAQIVAADGTTGNDVVTYQQVVLDTGSQTIAGDKTFSGNCDFDLALTLDTECTSADHGCTKTYIDAADSAISAGGCSVGSGAPVGVCSTGACYYDITTTTAPIGYLCYGADTTTWVKYDLDSIDVTNPVITSTDVDFTGAPAASATDSLLGLGSDIASGDASGTYIGINAAMGYAGNLLDLQVDSSSVFKVTEAGALTVGGAIDAGTNLINNVVDPVSAQDAATKNYVDSLTPLLFSSTTQVSVSGDSEATLIGSGQGSLDIAADTLAVGDVIRIRTGGRITTSSGPGDAAFDINLDATTIATGTADTSAHTNADGVWNLDIDITVRSIGGSGTVLGWGQFYYSTGAGGAEGATFSFPVTNSGGAVTVDTTQDLTVDFTVDNVTMGDPTWKCENFTVEHIQI